MAIQMRRGPWSQFDPTKMLPGEWAVILSGHPDTSNGQALYHCFAAGSVKQIATIEDAATIIANATEDIRDELTQDIASALAQVGAATNAANTATANANTATSAANAATQAATSASERAEQAIDAMGDISELAVPLMSKDIRGGAKLEEHGGLVLRDEKLGIGSLVQESDGAVRGGIAGLTAEGHAEQASTTGKNLLPNTIASQTVNGVTITRNNDGSFIVNGTATDNILIDVGQSIPLTAGTYTITGCPSGGANDTYRLDLRYAGGGVRIEQYGTPKTLQLNSTSNFKGVIRIQSGTTCNNITFYPQLELGSTATEYEPYTGGAPSPSPEFPQTIEVVRGRNLFGAALNKVVSGGVNNGFSLIDGGTSFVARVAKNTTYTIRDYSAQAGNRFRIVGFANEPSATSSTDAADIYFNNDANPRQYTFNSGNANYVVLTIDNATYYPNAKAQLTLGSTPQPYVPYGHVGMEARDPDTDELISCTALPLPSRGWVGSLPDGTADTLTLDGAGKVEWELVDEETTTAATDGVTGTVGVDVLSTTGQIADGATVLYKLATPVTEECGYVDMPAIPSDATVTIRELDDLGIKYFIDDSILVYGRQMYQRARSEYADRLEALEATVAELVTGA